MFGGALQYLKTVVVLQRLWLHFEGSFSVYGRCSSVCKAVTVSERLMQCLVSRGSIWEMVVVF